MMRVRWFVLFWCVGLVVPLAVDADERGALTGRVLDKETQASLPGANVVLVGTRRGGVTDKEGVYRIGRVPPGEYTVRASMIGYRFLERTVAVAQGDSQTVDFALPAMDILGEEVVVTATRTERFKRDVPVIVNVVDEQLFKATQSSSLSEGIVFQPGLRVETNCQNCGFTQVRLNGLEGGYSQILIDGRPIFSALDGVYGLDQIPTAMIDRVEVVRGGGSALFGGNAIAGTVNVITREPINSGFEISTNQAFVDGKEPDRNISINTSMVTDDQLMGLSLFGVFRDRDYYDADGDGFSEMTQLKNNSFGMRSFYRLGPLTKITLEMHSLVEDRRGGNRFAFQPHEADVAEALEHNVLGGSVSFETFFSTERLHSFSTYVSSQRTERDSYYGVGRDPNAYGFSRNFTLTGGAKYSVGVGSDGENELTVGVDAKYDDLQDAMPAYGRFTDQAVKQAGVYGQSDWKVNSRLSVLLGLRVDTHSMLDAPVLNPRANFLFNLTDRLQFRASGAMGFRAPQTFDEDLHIATAGGEALLVALNPDLGPERSYSMSGSVDYSGEVGELPWGVTLEGFYTRLSDPFVLEESDRDEGGNTILVKRNGDGAVVRGGTLDVRAFLTREFQFQGGVTAQSSRFDTAVEVLDGVFSERFMRTPDVYGYYTMIWQTTPIVNLSLSGVYTGSMEAPHFAGYIPEDRLEKTGAFLETNVKLDVDLEFGSKMPEVELQLGVQNVFNSYQDDFDRGRDRDSAYIYGPARPRTFFTGLKISY